MRKIFGLLIFIVLFCGTAEAQSSQIKIGLGSGYANGTITITPVLPAEQSHALKTAYLDTTGAALLQTLNPGITYQIVTCKSTGATCLAATVNPTGATQDITSALQANPYAGAGTGTVTSSGSPVAGNVAKFTAATNIAPAAATDIVALFSTCSGTQYLGADGACHTASAAAPLTLASGGTSVPLTVNTTGTGDAFQVQQGGTTFLKFGANESITYGDAFGNTTQWKQTVGFFDGYSDSAASILMYRLNTITGTFQEYGGVDVSASNGVASIPGYDKKSAQTSAISATTLFTVGASDTLFHIHIGISCDSTSSLAVVTPSVIFTSINGSSTRITDALNSATQIATCTTLGAASEGSADYTFNAKAGTTIQYSIAITNTPTYSYRVALTKLGIN